MPPKKPRRPEGQSEGPQPPRRTIASFKGSAPFAEWFDGLLEHVRKEAGWMDISASSVIERALTQFAKEQSYDAKPPER